MINAANFRTMKKSLLIAIVCIQAISLPKAIAQSFEELSSQYRSYDVQCQNSGTNCWARDQTGERLSGMGAYLCGRRDWYATPQDATAAGCR